MSGAINIFKGLSNQTRVNIVKMLLSGERCVCEITPHVKKNQSTVSIHLKKLKTLGLLKSRKEGRLVYYSISNQKVKRALKLLE